MVTELPSTWPVPPPRSRRSRAFWVAWVLLAALLGSLFVNLILLVALLFGFGAAPSPREAVVEGDPAAAEKILLIPVHGVLIEGAASGWGAADPVSRTLQSLERAEKDEAVKAVVLDIDSPGGGITDCDRLRHGVQRFRKARPQAPILASMGDCATSGGYYLAVCADRIFAHRSTITGSIGVIIPRFNLEGLAGSVGVKADPIKSKEHKDAGSPFRALTPEERAHFEGMVKEMYEQFLGVVLEGRKGMTREKLEPLADGSVMTGQRAMEAGLVDAIGYLDEAIAEARLRAKAPGAKVVRYERAPAWLELVFADRAAPSPAAEAWGRVARLLGEHTGRMMYLWWPGVE